MAACTLSPVHSQASDGAMQAEDDGFVDTLPGKLLADGLTTGSACCSCFVDMDL